MTTTIALAHVLIVFVQLFEIIRGDLNTMLAPFCSLLHSLRFRQRLDQLELEDKEDFEDILDFSFREEIVAAFREVFEPILPRRRIAQLDLEEENDFEFVEIDADADFGFDRIDNVLVIDVNNNVVV